MNETRGVFASMILGKPTIQWPLRKFRHHNAAPFWFTATEIVRPLSESVALIEIQQQFNQPIEIDSIGLLSATLVADDSPLTEFRRAIRPRISRTALRHRR